MMTKNAITVIDQELIDRFTLMVSVKEDHENVSVTAGELSELIYMAKDLIEINAELTKLKMNRESSLAVCANYLTLMLSNPIEGINSKDTMLNFLDSVNGELKDNE